MNCQTFSPPVMPDFRVRNNDLPVLPQGALEAMRHIFDPTVSNNELAYMLCHDTDLERRLLHLASACHYGRRKRVASLGEAITSLGRQMIYQFIVTNAVGRFYESRDAYIQSLWSHALATGIISHMVARQLCIPKPDQAFLAGILHDIGKLVLLKKFPAELLGIHATATREGRRYHEVEFECLKGMDHCMVGSMMAISWGCSLRQVNAILMHHKLETQPACSADLELIPCVVSIANILAHNQRAGDEFVMWDELPEMYCARAIGFTPLEIKRFRANSEFPDDMDNVKSNAENRK